VSKAAIERLYAQPQLAGLFGGSDRVKPIDVLVVASPVSRRVWSCIYDAAYALLAKPTGSAFAGVWAV
jgi:hypothetical protein